MTDFIIHHLAIVLPLYFVALWMFVVTLLGFISGWFRLASRFPDRDGAPILRLSGQSGVMGVGVNLNGILTLAVCPAGLRVSIWRLFGPFQRPFFVPWDELAVARGSRFGWRFAELRFGKPEVGRLRLSSFVANRLAVAAARRWPDELVPTDTSPIGFGKERKAHVMTHVVGRLIGPHR